MCVNLLSSYAGISSFITTAVLLDCLAFPRSLEMFVFLVSTVSSVFQFNYWSKKA